LKILEANGNDGVKPTTAVAAESMGGGARRHEAEFAEDVMPLAAGRGVMPRGCDGGVDDAMPSREDDGPVPALKLHENWRIKIRG
jgi:hypothetical protein